MRGYRKTRCAKFLLNRRNLNKIVFKVEKSTEEVTKITNEQRLQMVKIGEDGCNEFAYVEYLPFLATGHVTLSSD